mgnify:CR=1 FL=1
MSVMHGISLLGGLSLFLFGMKLMGEGLERAAGDRLKNILSMVTKNRVLAMLAGIAVTAVIQSSSAATVMVVGFVNAGLLSLTQAVGMIMGANIGTTVTSLMLSVKLDFGMIFACLGLLMTVLSRKHAAASALGEVLMGLGILFVGMDTMSGAMAPLQGWAGFRNAMASMDDPLLGVLIGAAVTAVLQSSSASVGILQALAGEGLISLHAAVFILFGQNIGTCVTALLASMGTNATAKRAAVVHLLFNVIGTVLFLLIALIFPFADWITALAPTNTRLQIAMVHIVFNVVTTLLLLPMAGLLEKAACALVRTQPDRREGMHLKYFDARLLATPPIAVAQLFKEVQRMGAMAESSFTGAMACFRDWNEARASEITENEDVLDYLNKEITTLLVEVKGLELSEADTRLTGSLFHVVNDMERVGDHSMNLLDAARRKKQDGVKLSDKALKELETLAEKVDGQLQTALSLFRHQSTDTDALTKVELVEEEIDQDTERLREHHVERLKNRKCSARSGMLYLDMLTDLERIGDHAENIATSVDKETPAVSW